MENKVLDLPDLVLSKQRPRKLQLLEDLRITGEVNWKAALVVSNCVVDFLVLQEKPNDGTPPLGCSDM